MASDSLFIGVSGLMAYQNQIDVISNNISNVGTVGYKGQDVEFQDLLYQNLGYSSAPTTTRGGINAEQQGDGVQIGAIDTNFTQGGMDTTGVNTNLAINGNGFFAMNNINGSGSTTYTRDGDFSLNESGYLYSPSNGLAVLGYPVQPGGIISQVAPPQPIQIPFGLKSIAVGTGFGAKTGPSDDSVYDVSLGGNLDQTNYITAVSTANVSVTATTITTTIYDSLGGAHEVQIGYQPDPPNGTGTGMSLTTAGNQVLNANGVAVTAATEWSYTVVSTDGSLGSTGTTTLGTGYVFFDANGQFINTSGTADPGGPPPPADYHIAGQPPTVAAGDLFSVKQWGTPNGANNATPVGTGTANPADIGLDFSSMTALNSSATANTVSQNGYGPGILSNITIGQDGTITGAFTNGQNQVIGRLALATFGNEDGLTRLGGNLFSASANSGLAQYGFANQADFGSIDAGSLEESNVSIASEFTKMIMAQRAFEANGKSITTADQDLQTVIGLKQ
ncbi:MAG: flagellar hook protein FlgE [Candidatus Lustribacter sp.]|jgi:flagellar hook protein FlgE